MAKKVASDPVNARLEALNTALGTIERKYGKGAVMKLSDDVQVDVPVIPTGSIGLDQALGVGGIPRGRVTEIFGPESSGKTTLTLHIIAECQKMGGICAFIDAEHALDVAYARKLGVNTDELLISQPDYGEQALDIADMLVRSGGVDLVVIDSVAALIPQAARNSCGCGKLPGRPAIFMDRQCPAIAFTCSLHDVCSLLSGCALKSIFGPGCNLPCPDYLSCP